MIYEIKKITICCILTLLTACGGGGGDASSSATSSNSFNLQQGYAKLKSVGFTKTFNITGSCTGNYTWTNGPATTAATFEGTAGFSATEVISYSWTGCTPPSGSTTVLRYYDSNYFPLGTSTVGGGYSVYLTPPVMPTAAKVGDVVVIGTVNSYSNSTKTTSTGRTDLTLIMEPDTVSTAIANLTGKTYSATGALSFTSQERYRITADNSVTPISLDIQYANPPTNTHIIGN
jgi:hypothetical protein